MWCETVTVSQAVGEGRLPISGCVPPVLTVASQSVEPLGCRTTMVVRWTLYPTSATWRKIGPYSTDVLRAVRAHLGGEARAE